MEKDQFGNWFLKVPLIGPTKERLEKLANFCGVDCPQSLAASLLHDLLEDDETAHMSPSDLHGTQH